MKFLLVLLFLSYASFGTSQKPCNSYQPPNGKTIVCVCNSTYCDEVPLLGNLTNDQVAVYTTSMSGKRFERTDLNFSSTNPIVNVKITIDVSQKFQQIIGFGGAATDAATFNAFNVSQGTRKNIVDAYFGSTGIGYTLIRVPMAATDFSLREYSYDDLPNCNMTDFLMQNFSLADEDFNYKIPFIKLAQNTSSSSLKLFATPWGPPAWLKSNCEMHGSGAMLKGIVGDEHYQAWALYFLKFFQEYAKQNVNFWGTTPQNEPDLTVPLAYPQTYFDAALMRDFIKLNLGPTLRNDTLTKDINIMIMDTNRYMLPEYPNTIFSDPVANNYTKGVAVHWYADGSTSESLTNGHGFQSPDLLTQTKKNYPDKFLLYTEACFGGPFLGSWVYGERYAHDIIENLNHWVSGWNDWNMIVNLQGGPSWVGTGLDAPIVVDPVNDRFYKQPMYYAIGHFSKFLVENSTNVKITIEGVNETLIEGTAFVTPSNHIVLVVQNRDANNSYQVQVSQVQAPDKSVAIDIEAKSIVTMIWKAPSTINPTSNTNDAQSIRPFNWLSNLIFTFIIFLWRIK